MLLNKKYLYLVLAFSLFLFAKPYMTEKSLNAQGPSLSAFTGQVQNQLIQLKIRPETKAKKDEDVVTVIAYVSVPLNYPGELNYQWQLTENVILIDGNLNASLKNLEKNKVYPIEIKVSGFSQLENRHITFKISGLHNGRKVLANGIVASKIEDTFEDVVKNVEKLRAENN